MVAVLVLFSGLAWENFRHLFHIKQRTSNIQDLPSPILRKSLKHAPQSSLIHNGQSSSSPPFSRRIDFWVAMGRGGNADSAVEYQVDPGLASESGIASSRSTKQLKTPGGPAEVDFTFIPHQAFKTLVRRVAKYIPKTQIGLSSEPSDQGETQPSKDTMDSGAGCSVGEA